MADGRQWQREYVIEDDGELMQWLRCTVCLAEYQEKDILRILPYCGHSFHVTCIDIWFQQHSTCPVCRISLRESPERKRVMQSLFSSAVRSRDGMDSLDSHSYYCSYAGHGYSSRAPDNRRMEPIQEDQFTSEVVAAGAGEIISFLMEDNLVQKGTGIEESQDKHAESPSNP